jgi:hypothetical protein
MVPEGVAVVVPLEYLRSNHVVVVVAAAVVGGGG